MPLCLTFGIGDELVLTDSNTGKVSVIEIDRVSRDRVRLCVKASPSIHLDSVKLNDRVTADKQAMAESKHPRKHSKKKHKPGPLGSTRVASAMQLEANSEQAGTA